MKPRESFHWIRLKVREGADPAVDLSRVAANTGRVATIRGVPGRSGLLVALTAGVALLGGVGAGAAGDDVAPTVSITKAVFDAKWSEGWLAPGAAVHVTGTVDGPAKLSAILRRIATPKPPQNDVHLTKNIPRAGRFTWDIRLSSSRALPGRYSLRIVGTSGTAELDPVDVTLAMPSPVEGVLDRAEVGTSQDGPWHLYDVDHHSTPVIHGKYTKLWTKFTFLSPPTGGKIVVEWRKKWRVFFGHVSKRYSNTIYTWAAYEPPVPLDKGTWLVTMKVNDRIAKRGSVRIDY